LLFCALAHRSLTPLALGLTSAHLGVARHCKLGPHSKGNTMNKEHIEGKAKEVLGKAQQELGKAIGSKSQQLQGLKKQVAGRAEHMLGDAKAVLKDAAKRF